MIIKIQVGNTMQNNKDNGNNIMVILTKHKKQLEIKTHTLGILF